MILEGLVTTRDATGRPHLAPMGPHVDAVEFKHFTLRPFSSSNTFRNLVAHPEGVLHISDDALLLARAAIGEMDPLPEMIPARMISGFALKACHRYYEFEIVDVDETEERIQMQARVVLAGIGTRPWFGFNRARHAVLEAAILATRVHLFPPDRLIADIDALQTIVGKTGGPDERLAMQLLRDHVLRADKATS